MADSMQTESRIGPYVQKLEQAAMQADSFEMSATVEFDTLRPAHLTIVSSSVPARKPNALIDLYTSKAYLYKGLISEGLAAFAQFCKAGRLSCDSIKVKCKGGQLSAEELKRLTLEAWCEAFAVSAPSQDDIKRVIDAKRAAIDDLRNQLLDELRGGPEGVKAWNQRNPEDKRAVGGFRRANLKSADLKEAVLSNWDFQSSKFDGAILERVFIQYADLRKSTFKEACMDGFLDQQSKFAESDFSGASLVKAHFTGSGLAKCNFRNADLTQAYFFACDLRGADLSTAILSAVKFGRTSYDEYSKWPANYTQLDGLEWKGKGKNSLALQRAQDMAPKGSMDFETFIGRLQDSYDRERLQKALKMLKAEKFQLFVEVNDSCVVGIVKSQSDPDLVYSCRVTSDGQFSCCTQNLFACGGLRGALCKHLLVLLIGLSRGGSLDSATASDWVIQSQAQKPELNKDIASETFIRYKGAEAGEIDWRPTETIPEDYYAY